MSGTASGTLSFVGRKKHGDDAYEIYAERWPEAGELGTYHAHYIHCYETLEEAQDHVDEYGGTVLVIDTTDMDVVIDNLEFPHPMVQERIPAAAITEA